MHRLASICPLSANSDLTHCSKYNRYLITSSPLFAERDVMECGLTKPASLRLDVEGPDHLAPLVGLFGEELTEVGGRACKQYAAHFSQPRLDLRVSKARVDCVVEFLDEFGRRVLGCTETQPRAGLVTCY